MTAALRARGDELIATSRTSGDDIARLDITDAEACGRAIADARPDVVIHLAGMTYLPDVLAHQKKAFDVNVFGTRNLLEATARHAPNARVLVCSTCSVFGIPDAADLPLTEDAPLRAMHPYGVQKIGLEVACERYRRDRGLDVVVTRPFNHAGPGLSPKLSVAFFARQIVAAERGEREPVMRVGNLEARRDYTDVRDVVRAYLMLLQHEAPPPIVNVASGRSIAMGEVLEALRSQARVDLRVETDPSRLRALDVPDLVGDATLLRKTCGWTPEIPIEETWSRVLTWMRGEDYGGDW